MKDSYVKFRVYLEKSDWRWLVFGFGIVWSEEKYIHFNLFNLELGIGRTGK